MTGGHGAKPALPQATVFVAGSEEKCFVFALMILYTTSAFSIHVI